MNHMRCCASESGTTWGRGLAISGVSCLALPATDSARAAKVATVVDSKSSRTPSCTPKAEPTRVTNCVATSEFPPSSKKSSSIPTRSTPRTSAKTSATTRSISVRGSRYCFALANTGSGNPARSPTPQPRPTGPWVRKVVQQWVLPTALCVCRWVWKIPPIDPRSFRREGSFAARSPRRARRERSIPTARHPREASQRTSPPSPQPRSSEVPGARSPTVAASVALTRPDQMGSEPE